MICCMFGCETHLCRRFVAADVERTVCMLHCTARVVCTMAVVCTVQQDGSPGSGMLGLGQENKITFEEMKTNKLRTSGKIKDKERSRAKGIEKFRRGKRVAQPLGEPSQIPTKKQTRFQTKHQSAVWRPYCNPPGPRLSSLDQGHCRRLAQ